MNLITSLLSNLNYGTIFFLMMLESTVVPVPSEFVVTPAAYHAASGQLDIWLVILAATIGADLGASINYFVALYVGRPVIYRFANSRWGKMCLLNIPAGLARMNYWKFLLYTTIGAGVWHSILAALGWYLHAIVPEEQLNDKISEYAEYIKIVILALVVLAIVYFLIKHYTKRSSR